MDRETFERLAPSFPDTDLVFLQGWGEPLLHPDIWRMVQRVTSAGAAAGFTTNGTLLDETNRERLIEHRVNVMAVSLAGTTPATHERFRSGCRFEAIDEALVALAELKRRRKSRYPQLHLAFLLLRSNIEEVSGLVDLARRWEASQIVVSNMSWIAGEGMEEECVLVHPELWPRAAEVLKKAKRRAFSKGILLHHYGPVVGEPRPICPENVLKACFVSHDGAVSPCVFTNLSLGAGSQAGHCFDGQHRRAEPVVLGNVREQTLPEIWNSERARRFREVFERRLVKENPGTVELPAACAHCYRLREA